MNAAATTKQITVRVPVALLDQMPRDRSAAIRDRLDLAQHLDALRAELREARTETQALRAELAELRREQRQAAQDLRESVKGVGARVATVRRLVEALGGLLDRPWRSWLGSIRPQGRTAAAALKEAKQAPAKLAK